MAFTEGEKNDTKMLFTLASNIPSEKKLVEKYTAGEILILMEIRVDELLHERESLKPKKKNGNF
ncbi:MAG: hypothetical protein EOP53_12670 [Sphingobacteriales bacterium]|nr:MAG: hypothetical protein EOP53_12670 [Sphingobacteriales bacterium]